MEVDLPSIVGGGLDAPVSRGSIPAGSREDVEYKYTTAVQRVDVRGAR